MGRKPSIHDCRTPRDFDRAIRSSGVRYIERQNGSSHRVYKFPDKGVSVPIPQHGGELPSGTRHSIIKMLMLVGLSVVFPFILCQVSGLLAHLQISI